MRILKISALVLASVCLTGLSEQSPGNSFNTASVRLTRGEPGVVTVDTVLVEDTANTDRIENCTGVSTEEEGKIDYKSSRDTDASK